MIDGSNTDAVIGVDNTNNAAIAAEMQIIQVMLQQTAKKSDDAAMSDDNTDNATTSNGNTDNTSTGNGNTDNTKTGNGNTDNTTGETSIVDVP